jgi:hypothetical protein
MKNKKSDSVAIRLLTDCRKDAIGSQKVQRTVTEKRHITSIN